MPRKKISKEAESVAKQCGIYDRYVSGHTRCRICNAPMYVDGTERRYDAGGVLIVRWMKCAGAGNHRYPLREYLRLQKPPLGLP